MAAGTVSGVAEFYRRQNQRIGLIWIDAHTDINTPESSPSGNVHGMPLAALMGLGPPELSNIFDFSPKVKPENCVLVGVRDIDAVEKENVRRTGIGVFTMRDIDERGMRTVMEEALRMAGRGTAGDPETTPAAAVLARGESVVVPPEPVQRQSGFVPFQTDAALTRRASDRAINVDVILSLIHI